ncbi:SsgA family sporulation/cell division regulator [Streptomyces sp. NPDC101160]|uniref:SsgA family sporulation/cell division regulator n=1 Tax=Streptomyces sp. NPDC101160 TaxID=3366118 RepID=UPI00381DDDCC
MSEPQRRDDRTGRTATPLVGPWHTVGHRVHAELEFPIEVTFAYDPGDPWAVRVSFGQFGQSVDWTLSRELLHCGTRTACGEGDVQLWPLRDRDRRGGRRGGGHGGRHGGRVRIRLGGTGFPVLVDVDRAALCAWLSATFHAVPAGSERERIDWAAEAAHIGPGVHPDSED